MCPYLFVYGTLSSAFDNPYARLLAVEAELVGAARLQGRLYQVDPHYPGLVLSAASGDIVQGDVFRMGRPEALLARLDEYEGCSPSSPKPFEYERRLTSARCDGGSSIEVWTYVYRRPVRDEDLIPSGLYEPHSTV